MWQFLVFTLKMGNFTVNIQSNMRVDFDEMVQCVERKDQMIDTRASDKLNLQGAISFSTR